MTVGSYSGEIVVFSAVTGGRPLRNLQSITTATAARAQKISDAGPLPSARTSGPVGGGGGFGSMTISAMNCGKKKSGVGFMAITLDNISTFPGAVDHAEAGWRSPRNAI